MTARRVIPEPRPTQAQQYLAAQRVFFSTGDLQALKLAMAADPAVKKESVWTYRTSAHEKVTPDKE